MNVSMNTSAAGLGQVHMYQTKSQVTILLLICSPWVTHLQVWEAAGMLCKCIYMGIEIAEKST